MWYNPPVVTSLRAMLSAQGRRCHLDSTTPTLGEYRRLYEAAIALKQKAPWEWMQEDEIFGVRNPETHEIGYVSIMGALGNTWLWLFTWAPRV